MIITMSVVIKGSFLNGSTVVSVCTGFSESPLFLFPAAKTYCFNATYREIINVGANYMHYIIPNWQ